MKSFARYIEAAAATALPQVPVDLTGIPPGSYVAVVETGAGATPLNLFEGFTIFAVDNTPPVITIQAGACGRLSSATILDGASPVPGARNR